MRFPQGPFYIDSVGDLLLLYNLAIPAAAIGLIGGSEIGMITIAGASKYKWKKAWTIAIIALLTFIPVLFLLYRFFTALPTGVATLASGIVIFLLGAYFFLEGTMTRLGKEIEEEEMLSSLGMVGIYVAILLEELEQGSIAMAIGTAGGSYISAILGMAIGIAIPLIAIHGLKPFIEHTPEWMVRIAAGAIMMAVALLILLYRF